MRLTDLFFPRLRSLWFGLTLPLRALGIILRDPALLFWSVLPIVITLALYGFLIVKLQTAAQDAVTVRAAAWGLSPAGWGTWLVLALTRIALFLVGALTFSFVAGVAASPFNDVLAEKAERRAQPPLPAVRRVSLGAKIRLLLIDFGKTLAATVASLAAILLSWIPGLNLGAFVLAFLLVAFQYVSYPQTRRGEGIRSGLRFLWDHLFACAGFGATVSLLFSVPLVASLSIPLAVVGGTLLYARAQAHRNSDLPAKSKPFRLR